jgi:hypothetical protein
MASSDHHLLGHLFRSARPTDLLARPRAARAIAVAGSLALGAVVATGYQATTADAGTTAHRFATTARTPSRTSDVLVSKGRQTFRFDTFGDQGFWGGVLHLDKAIEGAGHGGVGPGVSPKTALAVGLKVDVTKLPRQVRDAIAAGKVDLDDPGVTLALL